MTADDSAFLVALCAERAGLKVDPHKAYLVESRLGPVARREGFGSVSELLQAVRGRAEERLATACVEAMAPSQTAFFRDRAVFEHLWRTVVPQLARRRPAGAVRIWSVGCGAGQEVYSFAMLQAEEPAPTGRVELFASDLSERLLDRARLGVYSSFEVQRGLSARQLVRHFENRDEHFQLAKPLRQDVRWRRVNLLDDLAPLGEFDLVLCRYVLSALTEAGRARAVDQLSRLVAGDGVLVLGLGEPPPPGFVTDPAIGCVLRRAADVRVAA